MKIDQKYIDNISTDDFVKLLKSNNVEIISDKREIIQFEHEVIYYVKFNYQLKIISKSLFNSYSCIVNKEIIDIIFFANLSDAEFYLNNALCPSVDVNHSNTPFSIWQCIYLNDNYKELNDKHIQLDAAVDDSKGKLYFGIYKKNDYNNVSLCSVIKKIEKSYNINKFQKGYTVIKTNHVKDAIAEKDNAINMLKQNFNENKDSLNSIIIDEIDRTREYLDFLMKLAQ